MTFQRNPYASNWFRCKLSVNDICAIEKVQRRTGKSRCLRAAIFDRSVILLHLSNSIGSVPNGFAASQIQTVIPGQVNLIAVENGVAMQFWDGTDTVGDGTVDGGTSTWSNSSGNWTNAPGNINQSWIPGVGIFTGTAGVVTLAEPVSAMGLQFIADGYQVASSGAALTMVALPDASMPFVRVDAGATVDIGASIAGSAGLMKADAGTLVLSGTNN